MRSFRSVGGTPYTVARGDGAYVEDVDGTRYLDFVQSYGASLLGHAHPEVVKALRDAVGEGTTFGAPTPGEVLLAEAMTARVAGLEQVRLVSSGTEALMSAVRLARGVTGRDKIVKFDGCYHGHSDALLVAGGSGVAQMGLPGSAGVTTGAVRDTIVAPYNEVPTLDDDVAAVLVEPVAANMNLVAPTPQFLRGLRAECSRVGALLIFDEVITGFRLAFAGAQEYFDVTPDLWCFGKVIGGGLPGRRVRGIARGDVVARAARTGLPSRHAVGQSVGDGRGHDRLESRDAARLRGPRQTRRWLRHESGVGDHLEWTRAHAVPREGPLMGLYPLARAVRRADATSIEAKALCENGLYPSVLPRDARARRGARARCLRDPLRVTGPQ